MTVQLYPATAPNAVAFMLAWLAPLGPCGEKRLQAGYPVPFRMVNRVGGSSNIDLFSDDALISVHTFGNTVTEAEQQGDITRRRILALAYDPSINVVMADNSIANCVYIEETEGPLRVDYADTAILRVVARYRLSLEYVAVT